MKGKLSFTLLSCFLGAGKTFLPNYVVHNKEYIMVAIINNAMSDANFNNET